MTRSIAGETIVVPIRAEAASLDSVYVFNEVGARIWELTEQGAERAAIAATLSEEFEVASAQAQSDLQAFLETLVEAGLLRLEARP